jgi:uncharacterized protein
MERELVLKLLRTHSTELRQRGVKSLSLFGSVARGEARPESDVDLLIELEPPLTFDHYIQVKFFIEDLLERPVDLVMPETLKPRARLSAEREAILVA